MELYVLYLHPVDFFTYVYIYISIYLPFYSLLILLPKRRICDNNLDSWSTCGISNCDGLIMLLLYIFIDLTFVRSDNLLLMECDLYKSSFSGVTCTSRHFLVWPVQIVIFCPRAGGAGTNKWFFFYHFMAL